MEGPGGTRPPSWPRTSVPTSEFRAAVSVSSSGAEVAVANRAPASASAYRSEVATTTAWADPGAGNSSFETDTAVAIGATVASVLEAAQSVGVTVTKAVETIVTVTRPSVPITTVGVTRPFDALAVVLTAATVAEEREVEEGGEHRVEVILWVRISARYLSRPWQMDRKTPGRLRLSGL